MFLDTEERWSHCCRACVHGTVNSTGLYACVCVCVRYLQVVDEQLIEGRVSVKVDQETLVIHHSDSRGL